MTSPYNTFTFEPSEHGVDDAERRNFRTVLGHYPTGVAVVTALSESGHKIGLTVNSFISVSLHPPLILWSVGLRAPSAPVFQRGVRFAVNVLASHQTHIAQQFAKSAADKFADIGYDSGLGGVPVLHDTIGWLEAHVTDIYPGGDHLIIVGHVDRFAHLDQGHPLVYHRGRYKEFVE